MSCCAPIVEPSPGIAGREGQEILLASRDLGDGTLQIDLSVPAIHCAGCIRSIEAALIGLPGVRSARVNLTTKRVAIRWDRQDAVPPFRETLRAVGFQSHLHGGEGGDGDRAFKRLLKALAVAGFATSNIMLLAVSVWVGADERTRGVFHLISAALAFVTLVYSGQVFFVSAWNAVRRLRTNMDVPISVGVMMAFALSVYETVENGQHAYFDAAVSLLFVLLIGRTLDHLMRDKARTAAAGLARLAARGALVEASDGARSYLPLEELRPGMRILLAAGERVPVDGRIVEGSSSLDASLVSGEATPVIAKAGTFVSAGTLNLAAPLTMIAVEASADSFIARMTRLIEGAIGDRLAYRRLTDRIAGLYAPVVHVLAVLAFCGWLLATDDLYRAASVAIAVLIITCPCAIGLAVPMVQAVAARRLFDSGILLKNGSALERLPAIDRILFDKTGTLSLGEPRLRDASALEPHALHVAAALASRSRHPYALALQSLQLDGVPSLSPDQLREHAGNGIEARVGADLYRLGRPAWALEGGANLAADADVVLARSGRLVARFAFDEHLRPGAEDAVRHVRAAGIQMEILSGDRPRAVARVARLLDLPFQAEIDPHAKIAHVDRLKAAGRTVLMVGDGINDAPALAAAHVSMAPGSASDIGRAAADLIFLRDSLIAVPDALRIAREARQLIRQNLWIAAFYNLVAVPIALMGLATPLIAAIAMSVSSITVVANSLRLLRRAGGQRPAAGSEPQAGTALPDAAHG